MMIRALGMGRVLLVGGRGEGMEESHDVSSESS